MVRPACAKRRLPNKRKQRVCVEPALPPVLPRLAIRVYVPSRKRQSEVILPNSKRLVDRNLWELSMSGANKKPEAMWHVLSLPTYEGTPQTKLASPIDHIPDEPLYSRFWCKKKAKEATC